MASYFDDHDLSDQPAPAAATSRSLEELLQDFVQVDPPDVQSLASQRSLAERDPLPPALEAAIGLFDTLRLNAHSTAHQGFLESLIQDLMRSLSGPSGPPPAHPEFIRNLPRVPIPNGAVCSICIEGLEEGASDARELPCGHLFDRECLVPWLELRNTCPVCRKEVPAATPPPEDPPALFSQTSGTEPTASNPDEDVFGMYS